MGCARIARMQVVPAILRSPNASLQAVTSCDAGKLFEFGSLFGNFTAHNHFAFQAAAWYWHFVDVVWLCLFVFVYVL